MSEIRAFSHRANDTELFLAAPDNEEVKNALEQVAPESRYDPLLQEWRIPRDHSFGVDEQANQINRKIQLFDSAATADPSVSKEGEAFAYAQVVTGEGPEEQIDKFRELGFPDSHIFLDRLEGRYPETPKLNDCIESLRPGDSITVINFNRIARSLKQLATNLKRIEAVGAFARSIEDEIDTRSIEYQHFTRDIEFAANFEVNANRMRTIAGLKEAAKKGRRTGGRKSVLNREKLEILARMLLAGKTHTEIGQTIGVSRATIHRILKKSPTTVEDAFKDKGEEGVQSFIDYLYSTVEGGITKEKIDEIIFRYFKRGESANSIARTMNLNRETIRRFISQASDNNAGSASNE